MEDKWKLCNQNPTPTLRGLIKLRKSDNPIRPIVMQYAPACKFAKFLSSILHSYTPLPCSFSTHLLCELQEVPFDNNLKLTSLYITNMYTNVKKN
jgi:hypothetical protein